MNGRPQRGILAERAMMVVALAATLFIALALTGTLPVSGPAQAGGATQYDCTQYQYSAACGAGGGGGGGGGGSSSGGTESTTTVRAVTTTVASSAPLTPAPSPKTTTTSAPKLARLALLALRSVVLHVHKPSLHVKVRASRPTGLTLTLRDGRGRTVAIWRRHATSGVNSYVLLLPPKARKPGHATLGVKAAGNPAVSSRGVTLVA